MAAGMAAITKAFADISDADIEAQIERIVKHAAIEIDATQEQQEKITALVSAVAKDLKPVHDQLHASREANPCSAFGGHDRPVRTRNSYAPSALRMPSGSAKNLVSALADVAEVLSPEQRKLLDGRIKQFRSIHRGGHRG